MIHEHLSEMRPRMMSVAYRMLGSVADAEDAVQDAFLRLQSADEVTSPEGFLIKTTTRRCIDQLRASQRRKAYVGPWVPEPVDTTANIDNFALAESLRPGFLLLLERLSPTERAAFLLRSVFDYEYSEIAEALGKSEVSVRQIVSRAKSRLKQDAARFQSSPEEAETLAERFVNACRAGDVKQIEQFLTADAEAYADGGGKVPTARVVIQGRNRVARYLAGVFHKKRRGCEMSMAMVNATPGVVFKSEGVVVHVASLRIEEAVAAVYITRNPDKLLQWSVAKID